MIRSGAKNPDITNFLVTQIRVPNNTISEPKKRALHSNVILVRMNHSKEIHFEGKIAQKAIIVKEGRILLVRNPREQNEIWEIPGGRMNVHESPKEGLQREIFEELGIECEIHEVVYMTQFLQGSEKKNAFVIVYRATLADESKVFVLDPNEVCEMKWATQAECGTLPFFPEYTKALEIFFETYKKI